MTASGLVMPTRVLIVGGGAREHALAWKLSVEPGVNEVTVAPGSYAIGAEPRVRALKDVDPLDPERVVFVAKAIAAELVVVGPEAPLAAGIADALLDEGIAVFGPTAAAARIESSKAFCHDVALAAGVPMARARHFAAGERGPAVAFARQLAAEGTAAVVKADGLAAGKGVTVCDDMDAAVGAIDSWIGRGPIVVEERLEGREASLIALCDGKEALALPFARDHKRLGDLDTGPNTGGMGAYSPLEDVPDEAADDLIERIHRPILAELARRGTPFRGALYAGLMLTADGPVLLECNARFGDPETQVILPRLGAPLGPLLLAAAKGRLKAAIRALRADGQRIPTIPGATVGIVLAAAGYPDAPRSGDPIEGLHAARSSGALVFHAGTARDADGGYRTAGGRVMTVVGRGPDLASAHRQAESAAEMISFDGLQRRRDIGLRALIDSGALAAGSR
ncbi:MAG TPA: phosphoribosylamine--glycine ligase [Candidatus Limnocylindrales bacterium]|nr:phosphoribosylamine--glycine ligase [Candidatus Limnocylindrales bacterium]